MLWIKEAKYELITKFRFELGNCINPKQCKQL